MSQREREVWVSLYPAEEAEENAWMHKITQSCEIYWTASLCHGYLKIIHEIIHLIKPLTTYFIINTNSHP